MPYQQLRQYFNQLTPIAPEEWNDFTQKLRVIQKTSGAQLLQEGQVCDFVCYINHGLVRAYELVDGIEVNRTFFMQDFFATEYQSFLQREPSKEYLEVIDDAELVVIDYQHLQDMYRKYKSFERLGRILAESLYVRLRGKVERFLINSPEERYLLLLKDHPDYLDKIPHYHIASYLGITPQSLSRIRKRLQ